MQNSSIQNNPYNPLFEVVALTVSTKKKSLKSCNRLSVDCNLNFNRSLQLAVPIKNIDGIILRTVSFSLSIGRCILRLSLEPEANDAALFSIRQIEHLSPGYLENSSEVQTRNNRLSKQTIGAKANAKLYGAAGGELTYSAELTPKHQRRITSTGAGKSVNGTFSDRKATWDIGPNVFEDHDVHREFIRGEIFRNVTDKKKLTACVAEWKSEHRLQVQVSASVFVEMSAMNIGDIIVTDSEGEIITSLAASVPTIGQKLKVRMAKQVIRKFLKSSGSSVDGQLLEICRAHA